MAGEIKLTITKLKGGSIVVGEVQEEEQVYEPSPYFTYDQNRVITGLYQGSPNIFEEGTYEDWDNGYEDPETGEWITQNVPYQGWRYGGSNVVDNYALGIANSAFNDELYDMSGIPPSKAVSGSITFQNVTSIGDCAFLYCNNLTSVTISKTISQVQAMNYENWGLQPECTIHCTDGDITIS